MMRHSTVCIISERAKSWLAVALLCGSFAAAPAAWADGSTKAVTVDVLLPLTGPAAFLGAEGKTAIDTAAKVLARRGNALRFVYYDTESSPQTAVQLVLRLQRGGVQLILGPQLRSECLAVAPLVKKGPLVYCLSPTLHPASGGFLFTSGVDTHEVDRATVNYARRRGWRRIALITTTDATGVDALRAFKAILAAPENKDVALVANETFDPHDVSVAAQIARIAGSKPDIIFAWGTGAPIATVFRGIIQAGLTLPVATSFAHLSYKEMHAFAGIVPKQLYIAASLGAQAPDAVKLPPEVERATKELWMAFAATKQKPDVGALLSWDVPFITADAIHARGANATAEQLRQYIANLKGFTGINGIYDFVKHPQRGVGIENIVMYRWDATADAWNIVSGPMGMPLYGAAAR